MPMEEISDQVAVRVVNYGPKKLRLQYAGTWYEYPVSLYGAEIPSFAPYFAAACWFGDPRSVDIGDPDQDRATQYRRAERDRLSTFYGVYDEPWYSDEQLVTTGVKAINDILQDGEFMSSRRVPIGADAYVPIEGDRFRNPKLPNVVITRADTDEKIWTVVEDPEGLHGAPIVDTSANDVKALKVMLEAQQQAIARLTSEIAMKDPTALDGVRFDPLAGNPAPDTMIPVGQQDTIPDIGQSAIDDPEVEDIGAEEDEPVSHSKV